MSSCLPSCLTGCEDMSASTLQARAHCMTSPHLARLNDHGLLVVVKHNVIMCGKLIILGRKITVDCMRVAHPARWAYTRWGWFKRHRHTCEILGGTKIQDAAVQGLQAVTDLVVCVTFRGAPPTTIRDWCSAETRAGKSGAGATGVRRMMCYLQGGTQGPRHVCMCASALAQTLTKDRRLCVAWWLPRHD